MERAVFPRATARLRFRVPFVPINGRAGHPRAEQQHRLPEPRRPSGRRLHRSTKPLDEIHQRPRAGRELRSFGRLRVERDAWLRHRGAARGLDAEAREPHQE